MLTYRIRPRILKFAEGTNVLTPASATVSFTFAPRQAFGTEPGGGRTAVRAVPARVQFNKRSGQSTIESTDPLKPVALEIAEEGRRVLVRGNVLTVELVVSSQAELVELIETVYYGLPLLLAAEFADPPVVTDVAGAVDGHEFGWNLSVVSAQFQITTQELQVDRIRTAWRRLAIIGAPNHRRVAAALHYFHAAARLERASESPGEFLAEALLNYAKVLEVLFGPSTDTIRSSMRTLGFDDEAIERDFVPAVILRSQFDVAHVSLVLLNTEQLRILQRFADRAETQMRQLVALVVQRLDEGTLVLPQHEMHGADRETAGIIARMGQALVALGDRP